MSDHEFQILQIATSLYPFFKDEISQETKEQGYTHYVRNDLRRKALREAKELLNIWRNEGPSLGDVRPADGEAPKIRKIAEGE